LRLLEDVLRRNAYGRTACSRRPAAPGSGGSCWRRSHAAGFHERDDTYPDGLPADLPPRPDTLYGWSKASMEALGRLYVDRFGLEVICRGADRRVR
jgi:nucleoside-diphosphate-sugar epimerase